MCLFPSKTLSAKALDFFSKCWADELGVLTFRTTLSLQLFSDCFLDSKW